MITSDKATTLWQLVDDTIERWRGGESPDTAALLARHPELESRRELVLDLIHEELCLRSESGDTIVPSTFVAQFPAYRQSIVKLMEIADFMAKNPEACKALKATPWPQPGEAFLGFDILEPLGRGAMARVYLARELEMGRRPVVIKVAPQGAREAQLLGKLDHPGIVKAYGIKHDESSGLTAIVMPLLGTATCVDLINAAFHKPAYPETADVIVRVARKYQPAGALKQNDQFDSIPFESRTYIEGVIWMGMELTAALSFAHDQGVVHRDIKPSNVLLSWSGRPMLLDFNLSADVDFQTDRIGGTLAYMAPERIAAMLPGAKTKEAIFDPRTDVFSLGALLYELLTGALPANGAEVESLDDDDSLRQWLAARRQSVRPPSSLCPRIEKELDQIVLRALAYEPADRYGSTAEFGRDLALYLAPRKMAARWAHRNRRKLLTSSALAGAAVAAGGLGWSNLPSAAESHYQRGLKAYYQQDYKAAREAFNRSLVAQTTVNALFARGQSLYQLQDYDNAHKDYLAAAEIEPRGVFWFCAGCCSLMQKSDAAAAEFERAGKSGYREVDVLTNLGVHHHFAGSPRWAMSFLNSAIQKDPSNPVARFYRAQQRLNAAKEAHKRIGTDCVEDIEVAVVNGPPHLMMQGLAIAIFSGYAAECSAIGNREGGHRYRTKAIEALKLFQDLGGSIESLGSSDEIKSLVRETQRNSNPAAPPKRTQLPQRLYVSPPVAPVNPL